MRLFPVLMPLSVLAGIVALAAGVEATGWGESRILSNYLLLALSPDHMVAERVIELIELGCLAAWLGGFAVYLLCRYERVSELPRPVPLWFYGTTATLTALYLLWRTSVVTLPDLVFEEDGVMEWATAAFLLAAGFVYAARAMALFRSTRLIALLLAAASLAAILFALEEISWGQRVFGWQSGAYFSTYNYQAETNLHNFFNPDMWWIYLSGSLAAATMLVAAGDDALRRHLQPLAPLLPEPGLLWFALAVVIAAPFNELVEEIVSLFLLVHALSLVKFRPAAALSPSHETPRPARPQPVFAHVLPRTATAPEAWRSRKEGP